MKLLIGLLCFISLTAIAADQSTNNNKIAQSEQSTFELLLQQYFPLENLGLNIVPNPPEIIGACASESCTTDSDCAADCSGCVAGTCG